MDAEGAAAFRDLIESGGTRKLRAQSDRFGGYVSMMTLAVDYLEAMRARVPMRAALDALLGSTTRSCARRAGAWLRRSDTTSTSRRCRSRARAGRRAAPPRRRFRPATWRASRGLRAQRVRRSNGLPTSLQLIGRAFSESTLLTIGDRYQQATDWHTKRPKVGV